MADVQEKLANNRLVTLTGPGGCGKTRLAYESARELLDEFEDSIWVAEFAPLIEASLVPQTVASATGVTEKAGLPTGQALIDHFQARHALLIFDNCEHLIKACAELAEVLLQACPDLHILATSREPLQVSGENIFEVPPLSMPARQPWRSPTSVREALPVYEKSEAVQLFRERAAAVSPGFALSTENAPWVAEICRELDGMPLAIELASARVRSLSPQEIAERLDDRFELLTAGSRTAPHRQKTLEATIGWSYALLSPAEQKILQRLSIFSGGATLEAIEAVSAGEGVENNEIVELIAQVVNKSMVIAGQKLGETRYSLLETIRHYAHARLAETSEMETIRERHLMFFVSWATAAEKYLYGEDQIPWLGKFESEHDNLRAAMEFANSIARAEAGLRLAVAMFEFWKQRGFHTEGRTRLEAALALPGVHQSALLHAQALGSAGSLACFQSDYATARKQAEESLEITRQLGDAGKMEKANAHQLIAWIASGTGDHARAALHYEFALPLYRELGDLESMADVFWTMGRDAMHAGNYEKAEPLIEQSLDTMRRAGNPLHIAGYPSALGELALRRGQFAKAKSLLVESLNFYRAMGVKWGEAETLGTLGWLALRQRDFTEMKNLLRDSLAIRMQTEDKGGIAWVLEKLAEASSLLNEPEKAATIYGTAAALRAPIKAVMASVDEPGYRQILSDLQRKLGRDQFATLWEQGEVLPLKEAVDYALNDPASVGQSAREKYGGLTAREREVAALIAQGKTNREIAEAMTVREKTVETYVTRILNRLGFDSRVQVALWAAEHGLGGG